MYPYSQGTFEMQPCMYSGMPICQTINFLNQFLFPSEVQKIRIPLYMKLSGFKG